MPTSTFFRLPEEKRERLTEAAWEEFTQVGYANVSINKIVQKARIPRGSFYQYFSGKEDLFSHLLTGARSYFAEIWKEIVTEAQGDIFAFPLRAFDRYALESDIADRQINRFIQMIRINAGMDFQRFLVCPDKLLSDSTMEVVELSRFRKSDPDFIEQVVSLLLLCTASAVMETLNRPEQRTWQRACLKERVDILAQGALTPGLPPQ